MVSPDIQPLVIAVLGLGEAGSLIARDLAVAGTRVRGYDPAVTAAEPVLDTISETDAAREADLVLSVNSAKAAVEAFKAGRPGLLTGGRPRPGGSPAASNRQPSTRAARQTASPADGQPGAGRSYHRLTRAARGPRPAAAANRP
jgi:3-hydroxyisobutyrate dehydrogenase-like beta-hydroxyacid dehydrogenase